MPESENAEATGSNPVEARKTFFRATSHCLNCDSNAMAAYSFDDHSTLSPSTINFGGLSLDLFQALYFHSRVSRLLF